MRLALKYKFLLPCDSSFNIVHFLHCALNFIPSNWNLENLLICFWNKNFVYSVLHFLFFFQSQATKSIIELGTIPLSTIEKLNDVSLQVTISGHFIGLSLVYLLWRMTTVVCSNACKQFLWIIDQTGFSAGCKASIRTTPV